MKEAQRTAEPEGADLRDCESLIARIDGTLAALALERSRLEARLHSLRPASRPARERDSNHHDA